MMYRIGAIMYVIWGVLHLNAAHMTYKLGQSLEAGMVQGRIFQDAAFLLFFAVIVIVIALKMNWNNGKLGYWISLIAVSVTDVVFIVFLIIPGYVPIWPGLAGPLFWILGSGFSTLGILNSKPNDLSKQ